MDLDGEALARGVARALTGKPGLRTQVTVHDGIDLSGRLASIDRAGYALLFRRA